MWLHDSKATIVAYFLLEYIKSENYDSQLEPIKEELVEQLETDLKGYFSGSIDLGLSLIQEKSLQVAFSKALEKIKSHLTNLGPLLAEEKVLEIRRLNENYRTDDINQAIPTLEVIEWVEKIQVLVKN